MNTLIRNQSDLRAEIFRLQQSKLEKQIALKQHFSSPGAIMSTVFGLVGGGSGSSATDSKAHKTDWVSLMSRFVLPLLLNKTLFRGSGFIMKALVGLASQKAAGFISTDSVTGVWDKAKGLIGGFLSKKPGKPNISSYRKIKND